MDSKIKIIEKLIEMGNEFTSRNFCSLNVNFPGKYGGPDTSEWLEWKTRVNNIVVKSMAPDSPAVSMTHAAMAIATYGHGFDNFKRAKSILIKALENTRDALVEDIYGELKETESESSNPTLSNKVFVVHGHDSELKSDVERFIHEIGLEPIVLHRQVDAGNTVIEKFEEHSDVGYAFILLTPDEQATTIDQIDMPEEKRITEYRARPNVIFEFGYFIGKLGRSRVCCLHKGNVSVPSDLAGLVYKEVDDSIDSQAYAIIKELKNAGYKIKV